MFHLIYTSTDFVLHANPTPCLNGYAFENSFSFPKLNFKLLYLHTEFALEKKLSVTTTFFKSRLAMEGRNRTLRQGKLDRSQNTRTL